MQRVLGIDPGLRLTGYGVVSGAGVTVGTSGRGAGYDLRSPTLIEAGVIRLDARLGMEGRLDQLYQSLVELIEEQKPDTMAVEKLYAHYKHPRTAILMGHARGVILLAARQKGVPVEHLAATEVKKAVTGYGRASKQQIQGAVQAQFRLAQPPSPPDVADAIAIAVTAAQRIMIGSLGVQGAMSGADRPKQRTRKS